MVAEASVKSPATEQNMLSERSRALRPPVSAGLRPAVRGGGGRAAVVHAPEGSPESAENVTDPSVFSDRTGVDPSRVTQHHRRDQRVDVFPAGPAVAAAATRPGGVWHIASCPGGDIAVDARRTRTEYAVLVGRNALRGMIHDLMAVDRPPHRATAGLPIVVLEGCGGSGRTALLTHFAERYRAVAPLALVDAAADTSWSRYGGVSALLLRAMADLCYSSRVTETGPMTFPRMFIAYAALEQPLDLNLGQHDQEQAMRSALNTYTSRTKAFEWCGRALVAAGLAFSQKRGVDVREFVTDENLDAVTRATAARLNAAIAHRRLERAKKWFGELDLTGNQARAWVALSRAGQRGEQERVDRMLVEAFLADLRDNGTRFTWRRRVAGIHRRSWNFGLWLDNADAEPAQELLRCVEQVRFDRSHDEAQPAAASPATTPVAEPLLIVATSGGKLLEAGTALTRTPARVLEQDLQDSGHAPLAPAAWLVVRLRPLTEAEVAAMAVDRLGGDWLDDMHRVRTVSALSAGHPGAVRRLFDVLSGTPDLLERADDLLDAPCGSSTVSGEIIAEMVTVSGAAPAPALVQALVTLSAASDRAEAQHLLRRPDELAASGDTAGATTLATALALQELTTPDRHLLFTSVLWPADASGTRRLAEPARRLLLRELARRTDDDAGSWRHVFTELSSMAQQNTTAWCHRFARGDDPEAVARDLAADLSGTDASAWLTTLDAVTATPGRESPGRAVRNEFPHVEPPLVRHVARLAEGLRDLRDPRLTSRAGRDRLAIRVRDLYQAIGHGGPQPPDEFLTRAGRLPEPVPALIPLPRRGGQPLRAMPPWWRRRQPQVAAALAAIVLAGVGTVIVRDGGAHSGPPRCPDLGDTSYAWFDPGVSCLAGGAGRSDAPFRAALALRPPDAGDTAAVGQSANPATQFADLLTDIQHENQAVLANQVQGGATTCPRPASASHVTVAVLAPWSSPYSGARSVHELVGAYVAQWRANHLGQPVGCPPAIRMVAVDPGVNLEHWMPAVDKLLEQYPDLVAVTGLALSLSENVEAARRLDSKHIPVVADLVTADGFDQTNFAPENHAELAGHCDAWSKVSGTLTGFHRIAFSNRTHITNAVAALRLQGPVNDSSALQFTQSGYETDPFACTNVQRVRQLIHPQNPELAPDPVTFTLSNKAGDSSGQLQIQSPQICNNSSIRYAFYTARGLDLPTFINVLAGTCGRPSPITVSASSDATRILIPDPDRAREQIRQQALQNIGKGRVRLVFTVSSTLQQLHGQPGYHSFVTALHGAFAGTQGYQPRPDFATLADTWAFNSHDALFTVAAAVHGLPLAKLDLTAANTGSNLGVVTVAGTSQGTITFSSGATSKLSSPGVKPRSGPTAVRLCTDGDTLSLLEIRGSWPRCPGDPQNAGGPETS
jgi:hypothetical protein